MSFSKRKPYLKDKDKTKAGAGNMGLKRSNRSFFGNPVRYLKEGLDKESQFEKPYLSGDYPSMHLKPFTMPNYRPSSSSPFPPVEGGGVRSKIHTIIFNAPSCHTSTATLGCGDSGSLSFSIWDTPPSEIGGEWAWDVYIDAASPASLDDDVTISEVRLSGMRNASASVILSALEEAEAGTIVVCGKATFGGALLTKELQVDVPEGANPFKTGFEALGRPGHPPTRPSMITERFDINRLICCQEVTVEACCQGEITAWDLVNSAPVVNREASGTVYVTGSGDSIDWSITGTGFSIVGNGLSATVSASASACGVGKITATDCEATSAVGYVRTNVGTWANCDTQTGSYIDCNISTTCGSTRYYYTDPGHRVVGGGDQRAQMIDQPLGCDTSLGLSIGDVTGACADGVTVSLGDADDYAVEGSLASVCWPHVVGGSGGGGYPCNCDRYIGITMGEEYFKCA